ncbi:hypothetical protein BDW67DRAFT_155270 [Aspergillus spinulosporus]
MWHGVTTPGVRATLALLGLRALDMTERPSSVGFRLICVTCRFSKGPTSIRDLHGWARYDDMVWCDMIGVRKRCAGKGNINVRLQASHPR